MSLVADTTEHETIADVQTDIARLEEEIQTMEAHAKRKQKLNDSTEQWKSGAMKALKKLHRQFEPAKSMSSILDHFHIPPELFDLDVMESSQSGNSSQSQ